MKMLRSILLSLLLISAPVWAQSGAPGDLAGQIDGRSYLSPTGTFRVTIPVLPELGGRIMDTPNVVTFQDDFNVVCTIAAFPMDATQRWELSTRGLKDYLTYYFGGFVMPDFRQSFPGARVESAKFAPSIANGALLVYTLLPGGSMFAHRLTFLTPDEKIPDAKRGNLMFVRNEWVFVVSIELAERVLERSTYTKTTAEEDEILRQRLVELLGKMEFTLSKTEPTR
jgi:hypothetical protein